MDRLVGRGDSVRRQDELRLFDVGRQAQNMMIAAHAEGVGTRPVTLAIPTGVLPSACRTIG